MIWLAIPSHPGRAEWRARSIDWHDGRGVVVFESDEPTWTESLNRIVFGMIGDALADDDLVWYGSDDMEPITPNWLGCCRRVLDGGAVPAPYLFTDHGRGPKRIQETDGDAPHETYFSRVPMLSGRMAKAIGPWPPLAYCGDVWLSHRARELGWPTRLCAEYSLYHHWAQPGRRENEARWPDAQRRLEELVGAMGPEAAFRR